MAWCGCAMCAVVWQIFCLAPLDVLALAFARKTARVSSFSQSNRWIFWRKVSFNASTPKQAGTWAIAVWGDESEQVSWEYVVLPAKGDPIEIGAPQNMAYGSHPAELETVRVPFFAHMKHPRLDTRSIMKKRLFCNLSFVSSVYVYNLS